MSSAHIAAFILAGGQSSRMGTDKAHLLFNGKPLAQHAVELAQTVTDNVSLVGSRESLSPFGPVVEDAHRGCGPLGGIHAALRASRSEFNLILAVDTPFLSPAFLRFLVERAQASQATLTVPRTSRGWQPLCAVYRKHFSDAAEQALRAGHYRIDRLFSAVPVLAIEEAELRALAFDFAMFDNLNTPQDWQQAQQRAGSA